MENSAEALITLYSKVKHEITMQDFQRAGSDGGPVRGEKAVCCEGAALPSTEIEREAQGHLDLRGSGSGGMWTDSDSSEKSKGSETAGYSVQEQRGAEMAVLGVTWLSVS